jgi:hypothetical protein
MVMKNGVMNSDGPNIPSQMCLENLNINVSLVKKFGTIQLEQLLLYVYNVTHMHIFIYNDT